MVNFKSFQVNHPLGAISASIPFTQFFDSAYFTLSSTHIFLPNQLALTSLIFFLHSSAVGFLSAFLPTMAFNLPIQIHWCYYHFLISLSILYAFDFLLVFFIPDRRNLTSFIDSFPNIPATHRLVLPFFSIQDYTWNCH